MFYTLHAIRYTLFAKRDAIRHTLSAIQASVLFRLILCFLSSVVCLLFSTTVERALQIHPFLTNEPNFQKSQMNVSDLLIREYEQMDTWSNGKNEPKTNPISAQKMPEQTQTNPISEAKNDFSRHIST